MKKAVQIFAYNRPDHFRQTIEALAHNEGAQNWPLIVRIDGPKSPSDHAAQEQIQELAHCHKASFGSFTVMQADRNQGLARSIMGGMQDGFRDFDALVTLEDDLVTSPVFLNFMAEALEAYETEPLVNAITGYCYPHDGISLPSSFFIAGCHCWGWATWRRGWSLFQEDGASLLNELHERRLDFDFDFEGAYPYTAMLEDQIAGRNDSWAIRWLASTYLSGGLCLFPGASLVKNIGVDGSGTHASEADQMFQTEPSGNMPILPSQVGFNKEGYRAFRDFFWGLRSRHSVKARLFNECRKALPNTLGRVVSKVMYSS